MSQTSFLILRCHVSSNSNCFFYRAKSQIHRYYIFCFEIKIYTYLQSLVFWLQPDFHLFIAQHQSHRSSDTENLTGNLDADDDEEEDDISTDDDDDVSVFVVQTQLILCSKSEQSRKCSAPDTRKLFRISVLLISSIH